MEQVAANAERSSVKYKQVEYMSDKIGQNFEGTISGVTQWGFYVELNESKCEGLVSMTELDDDYYEFDEKNYCIVGRHHHKTYQLGDQVVVRVAKANLVARQLDYELVKPEEGQNEKKGESKQTGATRSRKGDFHASAGWKQSTKDTKKKKGAQGKAKSTKKSKK